MTATRSLTHAPERGWGPGWPKDRSADMARAEGGGVKVAVHELVAPVVSLLLEQTLAQGYWLRAASCGGYSCRAMKRKDGTLTDTPSNHSWGLAVDLNWHTNGFGNDAPHDIPESVAALWEAHRFNWGGRWNTADWMHFEFAGTTDDARRIVADLAAGGAVVTQPTTPEEALMLGFTSAVVPFGAHAQTAGPWLSKWPFVAVQVKDDGTTELVGFCGAEIAGGVNGFGASVLNLGKLNAPIVALAAPAEGTVVGLAPGDAGTFAVVVTCQYSE